MSKIKVFIFALAVMVVPSLAAVGVVAAAEWHYADRWQVADAAPPPVAVQTQATYDAPAASTVTVQAGPAKPAAGVINIGAAFGDWLQPYINAAVEAGMTALVSWVLFVLKTKFNIAIDAGHADSIKRALTTQANAMIASGLVKMEGLTVSVSNQQLADAANKVIAAVPDAVDHFGLTPAELEDKIVSMIPQTPAGAAIVAAAHGADPVPVQPVTLKSIS
jgi:hypothetical protein